MKINNQKVAYWVVSVFSGKTLIHRENDMFEDSAAMRALWLARHYRDYSNCPNVHFSVLPVGRRGVVIS